MYRYAETISSDGGQNDGGKQMNADELTKARIRNEYLQRYYADKATGYHPECEPVCVSEAAEMLPGLLEHIDSQASQITTLKAAMQQVTKLDGELARWREIAIRERSFNLDETRQVPYVAGENDLDRRERAKQMAAKELDLQTSQEVGESIK
jgi:hypothetical protein